MKYCLSILFIICFACNYTAQRPVEIKSPENESYFLGKWINTKNESYKNGKKISMKLSRCQKRSYWNFQKEKSDVYLITVTATGSFCKRIIFSSPAKINLDGNILRYFNHDVLMTNEIIIISDKKFILIDKDITTTEKTFEKQ